MTNIIRGNFGECIYTDCLKYMQSCKDKQFSLVFTDTIWGHDYQLKAQKPMGINQKATKQDRIPYNDSWQPDFYKQWFAEAQRISRGQVVCVGKNHVNWWVKEFDPIGMAPIVYKNGQGSTKISRYSGHMMYLVFGEESFWKHHKFHRDFVEQAVYETYIHNGFLRDNTDEFKHPSPKDFETWKMMIQDLNQEEKLESIYDPFAGSVCIGEVCEALGIPWVATEIMPDYLEDGKIRIAKGIQWNKDHPKMKPTNQKTMWEMLP